jgi:hypothetical protein
MKKLATATLVIGALLAIYGYVCRSMELYVFWESLYVGWAVIMLGLVFLLIARIRKKKALGSRTILEKIGIAILLLILLAQLAMVIVIPQTSAFEAATDYIQEDPDLADELGEIQAASIIPLGSLQVANGEGTAELKMTLKGEKKFKDVTIFLEMERGSDWTVTGMK